MRTPPLVLAGLVALLGCGKDPPPATSTSTSSNASAAPAAAAKPGELAVGAVAPDFTAKSHDGKEIKISALKGKPVVVYFYPKDETPGCTKEACAFRDSWNELAATGVVMIGISTDTLESHKKFAEHHKLPFHLVSDEDGSIAKAYGVSSTLETP